MRRWDRLNDRQLALLRRIGEGTDPVSQANPDLSATVYALRNRGLVTTPRRNGLWQAEITDAGTFYLEHGHHPDRPDSSLPEDPAAGKKAAKRTAKAEKTSDGTVSLIRRLQQAGGTLHISDPDKATRAHYRRVLHAAVQRGVVPDGFHLLHTGRDAGDLVIRLESDEHRNETEWNRIRLSARDLITDPDQLATRLQDDRASVDVSEPVLPRALTFIRTLAEEADRRGFKLAISRRGRPRGLHAHARGHQFRLNIKEELDAVPHHYTEEELRRRKRYSWQRIEPETDSVPSGRLRLEVVNADSGENRSWADDGRSRIEDKAKSIIKEMGQLADAAEERRLARERAHAAQMESWRKEEEQRELKAAAQAAQWRELIDAATERVRDDHRAAVLGQAMDAWMAAAKIREFCDALERASSAAGPEEAQDLPRWVEYGRLLADSMDPCTELSVLADESFDVDPTPDDLRPHIGEWSPHRPEREYRPPSTPLRYATSDDLAGSEWRWGRPGRAQWWRR